MNIQVPTFGNQRRSLAQADATSQISKQSQENLSKLWWSVNWPIVAVGVGALGVMGYLIFKKK